MRSPDTAIIPCGGLGTRMHPVTRWIPKELLPVALTPLIHWALFEASSAGLARAIVVTNPAKPILGDVARDFMVHSDLQVVLVSQDQPAGLGDAMMRARPLVGDHPFAVVLPDNFFRGPNQTAAVLAAWDRYATATVLIAEVAVGDAVAKGHRSGPSAGGAGRLAPGRGHRGQGARTVRHRRWRPRRHADRQVRAAGRRVRRIRRGRAIAPTGCGAGRRPCPATTCKTKCAGWGALRRSVFRCRGARGVPAGRSSIPCGAARLMIPVGPA